MNFLRCQKFFLFLSSLSMYFMQNNLKVLRSLKIVCFFTVFFLAIIFDSSISYTSCLFSQLTYPIGSAFTLPVTHVCSFAQLLPALFARPFITCWGDHYGFPSSYTSSDLVSQLPVMCLTQSTLSTYC